MKTYEVWVTADASGPVRLYKFPVGDSEESAKRRAELMVDGCRILGYTDVELRVAGEVASVGG